MPKVPLSRNHHLHMRLSDFENMQLKDICKETNQTISDFVREAILEKKERIRVYEEIKNSNKQN